MSILTISLHCPIHGFYYPQLVGRVCPDCIVYKQYCDEMSEGKTLLEVFEEEGLLDGEDTRI